MRYDFQHKKFIDCDTDVEKLAVSGSDADITWAELKIKTEKFADLLKKLQIPTGHPVIIYGHKEHLFPVAILACLHSNIPYIPIDKIYPIDRIKKISAASGSQAIINCTNGSLAIQTPITINANFEPAINSKPDFTDNTYGNANDPIQYIMFTSGSTGEPKGVQITQAGINTFIDWITTSFKLKKTDVFMNQAPFTFDISLFDTFGAFAMGGTLILNTHEQVKDHDLFLKRIKEYKCTFWNSTPSFVYIYLRDPAFNNRDLSSIHTFLFMGEELPNRTVSVLKKNFNNIRVLNAYGPTEATVITTAIEITDEVLKQYPVLPIGYAMPASTLLIEKNTPENKEGELIIVGDHVSTGYLKNEELNSNKFFLHNGKRAFKTGDLAYYENDLLFFVGRNDEQIKLHGYRIELSEINNVLTENSIVLDAITIPLKRNNEVKKIVSFIKLKHGTDPTNSKETLLLFLGNKLPYYMIPGDISFIESFPYNVSHKIDKKKLVEDYINNQA